MRGSGPAGEGTVGSLTDDLDGDPVKVGDPEGQPHLASGPSTQDPAHFILGGELLGEGFLHIFVTHEHEHLLGGIREADLGVVFQRPDIVLSNFVAIHPGPWRSRLANVKIEISSLPLELWSLIKGPLSVLRISHWTLETA